MKELVEHNPYRRSPFKTRHREIAVKSLLTRLMALLVVLLVFSAPVITYAQLIEGRVVAPTLNVRSGPTSHTENVIGQTQVDTLVSIDGRNPAGDWFYIRAEDSSLTGWAAAGFIAYIQDQYGAIPVLTEAPAVAAAGGGDVSTGQPISSCRRRSSAT